MRIVKGWIGLLVLVVVWGQIAAVVVGGVSAQADPTPADAEAALAVLTSIDGYDRYILRITEYTELDERFYPAGEGQNDNRGRLVNINRQSVNAVDLATNTLQRDVEGTLAGDLIIGARLVGIENSFRGEVRGVDGTVAVLAEADDLDTSQSAPPVGWFVVDGDAPPQFDGDRIFGVPDALAFVAGESDVPSLLGDAPTEMLQSADDILSRVDEIRVQTGRATGPDGGVVTYYRLLGDGLADVVVRTAPIPMPTEAAREAVTAAIADVSLAVVADDEGRLLSRVVTYNLTLVEADATLFGLAEGTITLRAAVNIVEQFEVAAP